MAAKRIIVRTDPATNPALRPCDPRHICGCCAILGKRVSAPWVLKALPECFRCEYHATFVERPIKHHPFEIFAMALLVFAGIGHNKRDKGIT